jgi:transposase
MTHIVLSPEEHRFLVDLARHTFQAQILRRVQALLWLGAGESIPTIAARLQVTCRTIYYWAAHFQAAQPVLTMSQLVPRPRSGRPRTAHGVIDPLIAAVIDCDPRDLGYRSTVWTAPLLQQYLWEEHDLTVSRQSVSLAIDRLGLRWKRPRHRLVRRMPTWRQATGGSNAGSESAHAPSS